MIVISKSIITEKAISNELFAVYFYLIKFNGSVEISQLRSVLGYKQKDTTDRKRNYDKLMFYLNRLKKYNYITFNLHNGILSYNIILQDDVISLDCDFIKEELTPTELRYLILIMITDCRRRKTEVLRILGIQKRQAIQISKNLISKKVFKSHISDPKRLTFEIRKLWHTTSGLNLKEICNE